MNRYVLLASAANSRRWDAYVFWGCRMDGHVIVCCAWSVSLWMGHCCKIFQCQFMVIARLYISTVWHQGLLVFIFIYSLSNWWEFVKFSTLQLDAAVVRLAKCGQRNFLIWCNIAMTLVIYGDSLFSYVSDTANLRWLMLCCTEAQKSYLLNYKFSALTLHHLQQQLDVFGWSVCCVSCVGDIWWGAACLSESNRFDCIWSREAKAEEERPACCGITSFVTAAAAACSGRCKWFISSHCTVRHRPATSAVFDWPTATA